MRMTILLRAFLLLALGGVANAQLHTLKLERPMKVGDQFSQTSWYEHMQRMTVSSRGQAVLNQDSVVKIYLLADGEVVNTEGGGRVRYEIFQLLKFEHGDTIELAAPGTSFIRSSEENQGETITAVEGTLSQEATDALSEILSDLGRDADKNYGTSTPQRVGGSWEINTAKAAEDFSKGGGINLSPKNIKGTARLAGVSTMGEIPIYKVKVDIDLTDLKFPAPEGFNELNGAAVVQFEGQYPVDESLPLVRSQMLMLMDVDGTSAANAPELALKGTIRHSVTSEFVYKR